MRTVCSARESPAEDVGGNGSAPAVETPPIITTHRREFSEATHVPAAKLELGTQGLGDAPHCGGADAGGVLSIHLRPLTSAIVFPTAEVGGKG